MRDHLLSYTAALILAELCGLDDTAVGVYAIPENDPQASGERVDLVADLGGCRVAIEHTQVESFPGQKGQEAAAVEFTRLVASGMRTSLPSGRFQLVLPNGALSGIKRPERADLACKVATWIDANACPLTLEAERPIQRPIDIGGTPSAKGLALNFRPADNATDLQPVIVAPQELEVERTERLGTSLSTKLPKLHAEKRAQKTCLVLEDDDMWLANEHLVTAACKNAALKCSEPLPTWVLLVETFIPKAQWVALLESGEWIPAEERKYRERPIVDVLPS